MKRGRHAADDGSFGRSSGMAAGRAAALLAAAVVIGIVLLNAADDDNGPRQVSAGSDSSTTSLAADETTTTFAATTTTLAARAPKDVKVLATNGTDVKGAARRATDTLRTAGFNVLAPVDAEKNVTATAVYFTAGFEREAQAVASSLGLGAEVVKPLPAPPPVADVRGANVVVLVGPDTAARLAATPSSTPTTKAATPAPATTKP